MHAPGDKHLQVAHRAVQYLKGSIHKTISDVSDSSLLSPLYPELNQLVAFSYADYAGCPDTAKSMTGYVVIMNGGPIA